MEKCNEAQEQQINTTSVRLEHAKRIHELKCDRFEWHCGMDDGERWARYRMRCKNVFTARSSGVQWETIAACRIPTQLTQSRAICLFNFIHLYSAIVSRFVVHFFVTASILFGRLIDGAFSTKKRKKNKNTDLVLLFDLIG